jgi:hypothetical protein
VRDANPQIQAPLNFMKQLKSLWQTAVSWVKQTWRSEFAPGAGSEKRRLLAVNLEEAERLDRIRNPSKYLGK